MSLVALSRMFTPTELEWERLEKNGKISSDERIRLKDEIETKKGNPKVADSTEIVQKELERMKIVNREDIWDTKVM